MFKCICNNSNALVVERAKINGIPVEIVNHRDYKTREAFDTDVANKLIDYKVQIVAMAGWMRIASSPLVTGVYHIPMAVGRYGARPQYRPE